MKHIYILKLLQEPETWWLALEEDLDLNSRMAWYIRHRVAVGALSTLYHALNLDW